MNRTVAIVLVVVCIGVAGVLAYGLWSGAGASPTTDEAFVETVRQSAGNPASVSGQPSIPRAASDRPIIELEMPRYDIGLIANDEVAEGGVRIYNRGGAPLYITRITTECGCTMGYAPKQPIPPGEHAVMRVTVDPFRIPAFESTKTLTIFSNDPLNPAVRLPVHAQVEREISWDKTQFKFGRIPKGTSPEMTAHIQQLEDEPLEVTRVATRPPDGFVEANVEMLPEEEWQRPGKREFLVTTRILPNAPVGVNRGRVDVALNLPRIKQVLLPVEVEVVAPYSLSRPTVTLRDVVPNETVSSVLTVSGDEAFEILSVESENEAIQVTKRPGDTPNSTVFDLTVAGGTTDRLLRDNWKLHIRTPEGEYEEAVRVTVLLSL